MAKTKKTPTAAPVTIQGKEQTGAQAVSSVAAIDVTHSELASSRPVTWSVYRSIRKHPTIALARAMITAPVVASEWTIETKEDAPSDAKQFIEDQLFSVRQILVRQAMEGMIDYGFHAWEKVWATVKGRNVISKFKALYVDDTKILVDPKTGVFNGLRNRDRNTGQEITLELPYSLTVADRIEGTNWYGEALLETPRRMFNAWNDASDGAQRYDQKLAGSHWVVRYPVGKTPRTAGGTPVDNSTLAQEILEGLMASGGVIIPNTIQSAVTNLQSASKDHYAWQVEMVADQTARQPSFVERLNYLDKLLVRGMLAPERSIIEGQFGTKAEAVTHTESSILVRELEHQNITRIVNWHVVDQLLALNYGEETRGSVYLCAVPLQDTKTAWLRQVWMEFVKNPTSFAEAMGQVDTNAVMDALGLPKNVDTAENSLLDNVQPPAAMDRTNPNAKDVDTIYEQGGASN